MTAFIKGSLFVLFKNPILFLLPILGSVISIIVEAIFTVELYYNNGNKVFFPNIIILGLFFAAFMIIYFQLNLSKQSVRLTALKNNNLGIEVLELFTIYSIYSLVLFFIGSYEGQLRETFSPKSDPFSLYTFKIATFQGIINIIPNGVVLILLSTLTSFLFGGWLVQYMVINDHPYRILKSLMRVLCYSAFEDLSKDILLLFLVTLVISVLDFVLTNIAVIHVSNTLQLYLYQFVILSLIHSLYAPLFLVWLFLIILSGSYSSA